jgi:predicted RNA binding protein YcfA (HicA-like mRNA interferase family)
MKLPRGVSADRLIRALERLGYAVIRQKGSHLRLFHEAAPTHSISVPLHDPLKIGTFHGILVEVAQAQSISIQDMRFSLPTLRQKKAEDGAPGTCGAADAFGLAI